MKTRRNSSNLIATSATAAVAAIALSGAAQAQSTRSSVYLNGQPLATEIAPITREGRTLVPMRDIFEALGAQVVYNPATRGIVATRGTTNIGLQIGARLAYVNNQRVQLDEAPAVVFNRTLVPLRFVSEALGATVSYNAPTRIVSITTDGNGTQIVTNPTNPTTPTTGEQVAGVRQVSVPAGAVVPVTLDAELSSKTSRVGDRFTASVVSQREGDSEFPPGSKVEGVITASSAQTGEEPGVLSMDFRTVILPDGQRLPLQGQLISLDNESVSDNGAGRITAKSSRRNDTVQNSVIGAGVGYAIGRLLKKDGLTSAIIGAAGGFLYDRTVDRDRTRFSEAVIPAGTRIGVRVDSGLTYADASGYAVTRTAFLRN